MIHCRDASGACLGCFLAGKWNSNPSVGSDNLVWGVDPQETKDYFASVIRVLEDDRNHPQVSPVLLRHVRLEAQAPFRECERVHILFRSDAT